MDFQLPELGEGVYEAELVEWHVKPGDTVKRGQTLMEALTDKATMEVPAAFNGEIESLSAEPGDQVKVGQVVLQYKPAGAQDSEPTTPTPKSSTASTIVHPPSTTNSSRVTPMTVKAAPSVRYMARQMGVDLTQIEGTGPQGRILIEDLSRFTQPSQQPAPKQKPTFDYGTPGTRIKFAGLRRKIAEHMVASKTTIPHYSYVDECDITDLVRIRQSLQETTGEKNIKLTYVAFAVKAVAKALKEIPIVNAMLDEEKEEIILHDHYHIGIAVATQNGLVVPVVRDADKKGILEVAREVQRLSEAARTGKLKREDMQDGTFTITSIGNIGGLFATPIIHHPQVGIVGIGKIVKRPAYDDNGNIRPADMVYLSFSFDHRVLDGAVGAAFGNAVMKHLQNPAGLLL